jgi:hypothetical protein
MWILKNSKDVSIYNHGHSPYVIALHYFTSKPFTQLFPTQKTKRQIKRISSTLFHKKE